MADYAGAIQAIRDRLAANWTTTPIAYMNEGVPVMEDPNTLQPMPWVMLEVINTSSEIRGIGTPGDILYDYFGLIYVHVFVPQASGISLAMQYAVAIGEIFRTAEFYNEEPGHAVRTWVPRVDGGGSASDDGVWWRVTCTVDFEYLHRG
jgi:hypothetical protein